MTNPLASTSMVRGISQVVVKRLERR